MLIRNATRLDIESALFITNAYFDDNLKFRRLDYAGRTRAGSDKYTVTLTVDNSSAAGSRIGRSGRRISAACWHAYGTFRDNLPDGAEIVTSTARGRKVESPGDRWEDWNIGSTWYPMYYSEACDC